MEEVFAKPCVGAILQRNIDGVPHILVQTRNKEGGGDTNGMLELPAGKIREYEDIFTALRREVREETGLRVTRIHGEDKAVAMELEGKRIRSFQPYCTTQNLCGAYSILLHHFLCEAEGEPVSGSDESSDVHWMPVEQLRELLTSHPERIFFLHWNALYQYLNQ